MNRLFAVLLLLAAGPVAVAENVTFPAGARVVDVTKPPYSAKGDGRTDDTAAVQKALDDHPNAGAVIYLPNGTYRVSDQLKWPKGDRGGMEHKNTILQGQSRDKTVLKLTDAAAGFDDPKKRRGVIWTGQKPAQRFRNAVRNLTIDTGKGNPGACGMQFMANNQGGVFDVTVRSGDGSGVAGLDFAYTDEIGPLLVRNVSVDGFDFGVLCAFAVDSLTFENVSVSNQKVCGFENRGQVVSVRGLTSTNAVPAVGNSGAGLLVLLDSELTGTGAAKGVPAITAGGVVFARNVKTSGYKAALVRPRKGEPGDEVVAGPDLTEYGTHPPLSLFDGAAKRSLDLPIKDPPEIPWGDPERDWTSPFQHGYDPKNLERPAKAGQNWQPPDASDAIQKAIDSGKPTVYLPRGNWVIGKTVVVRGKCRRLIGCEAQIAVARSMTNGPVIRIEDGDGESVILERLRGSYDDAPDVRVEHATRRAVVIRNVTMGRSKVGSYRNQPGAGPLFLDDVVGGHWVFTKQEVYARQFNVEGRGLHVKNDGGTLWVLGYKTEGAGVMIETCGGGKTELLGGFIYTTHKQDHTDPMFVCTDSAVSLIAGETCFTGKPFPLIVRETRGGVTKELPKGDAKGRPHGSLLPLYVSGR